MLVNIVDHPLKRSQLKCLRDKKWLRDDVLDAYMALLQERAAKAEKKQKFLPMHFYQLISAVDYNVRSGLAYVKEQDLFEWDYLYIPINVDGNHWVMVVVDFKKHTLWALDPLPPAGDNGYGREHELATVARFLNDLGKARYGAGKDVLTWSRKDMLGIPVQPDTYNCGVYVLMYAECMSRGSMIVIDPNTLPHMRQRIAVDLVGGSISRGSPT